MPKLDTYGSQPPLELLRQYQDFGGFYDREKLFWKQIKVSRFRLWCVCMCMCVCDAPQSLSFLPIPPPQDVTICAACAPPGGGRNPVTPRLIRHFAMFCLPSPSEVSLKAIFMVRRTPQSLIFLFFLTSAANDFFFCLPLSLHRPLPRASLLISQQL